MPLDDSDALFDAAFRRQLESLRLLSRRLANGRQRAERRSSNRGASVEFAGYRPFSAGDDWRHIDWNAYARWRQLVLKLFVEEEDLHVHLLLDCTRSMDWGEPCKFDTARRLVAGLAYLALSNLDRAGIVPLGNPAAATWAPSRGRGRFPALLRHLAACPVGEGAPPLAEAVRSWTRTRPRRGLAVIVSDLWGTDRRDALHALDLLRHNRHETAVLQIVHPDETEPPLRGEVELTDRETGRIRRMVVDEGVRRVFAEKVRDYEAEVSSYCLRNEIAFLRADATESPSEILRRTLLAGGFVG